jgi:hypothetical protein
MGQTGATGPAGATGPTGQAGLYGVNYQTSTQQSGVITLGDNTSTVYLLDAANFPSTLGLTGISNTGVDGRVVTLIWNAYYGDPQPWIGFNSSFGSGSFKIATYPSFNPPFGQNNVRVYGGGSITFVYVAATGFWYQIGIT